jgi:phage shock protein A
VSKMDLEDRVDLIERYIKDLEQELEELRSRVE